MMADSNIVRKGNHRKIKVRTFLSEWNGIGERWMREEEKREGNVFVGGGMMSGGELLGGLGSSTT